MKNCKPPSVFLFFLGFTFDYLCYHCNKGNDDPNELLHHILRNHKVISIRQKQLSEETGLYVYRSIHLNLNCDDVNKVLLENRDISLNIEEKKTIFT